jgi:NitT/TauT family transport system substrate-binding protein
VTGRMTRGRALVAGAALAALPLAARAQSLTPIEAGGVPEDGMTPALYAQEAGILRAHGLDVHFAAQRSGSATTAAVIGGAYALGKASVMSLINAHVHGVPLVLIFPGGVYKSGSTHSGMIVRADSPIKTGADVNGKLVAVSALNDLYTIGAYAWVDAHGGDWTSLKLLEIPISAITEAVVSGRVDVGNLTDPFFTSALDTKKVRLLADTDAAIAPQFALTAWFATRDYVRANPAIIQAFRAALHEAAIYANNHHAQTVDAIAKFSGQDPSVVARMNRMAYGTELDPKLIQPLIDDAAKFKVISAGFDARDFIASS